MGANRESFHKFQHGIPQQQSQKKESFLFGVQVSTENSANPDK